MNRDERRGRLAHIESEARVAMGEVFGETAMRVFHPWCRICGWRKGGADSWDGHACKCGLHEPALTTCHKCGGMGKVPCGIGSQHCPACDGSGLVPA